MKNATKFYTIKLYAIIVFLLIIAGVLFFKYIINDDVIINYDILSLNDAVAQGKVSLEAKKSLLNLKDEVDSSLIETTLLLLDFVSEYGKRSNIDTFKIYSIAIIMREISTLDKISRGEMVIIKSDGNILLLSEKYVGDIAIGLKNFGIVLPGKDWGYGPDFARKFGEDESKNPSRFSRIEEGIWEGAFLMDKKNIVIPGLSLLKNEQFYLNETSISNLEHYANHLEPPKVNVRKINKVLINDGKLTIIEGEKSITTPFSSSSATLSNDKKIIAFVNQELLPEVHSTYRDYQNIGTTSYDSGISIWNLINNTVAYKQFVTNEFKLPIENKYTHYDVSALGIKGDDFHPNPSFYISNVNISPNNESIIFNINDTIFYSDINFSNIEKLAVGQHPIWLGNDLVIYDSLTQVFCYDIKSKRKNVLHKPSGFPIPVMDEGFEGFLQEMFISAINGEKQDYYWERTIGINKSNTVAAILHTRIKLENSSISSPNYLILINKKFKVRKLRISDETDFRIIKEIAISNNFDKIGYCKQKNGSNLFEVFIEDLTSKHQNIKKIKKDFKNVFELSFSNDELLVCEIDNDLITFKTFEGLDFVLGVRQLEPKQLELLGIDERIKSADKIYSVNLKTFEIEDTIDGHNCVYK